MRTEALDWFHNFKRKVTSTNSATYSEYPFTRKLMKCEPLKEPVHEN